MDKIITEMIEIKNFMKKNEIKKIEITSGNLIITKQRKRENELYIPIYNPND